MDAQNALARVQSDLVLTTTIPADRHPALVYLASLAPGSRRTMRGSLDAIARLVSQDSADLMTFDWTALRYHHTNAIRSLLTEQYKPGTANKMLAALRRVLLEA